MVALQRIPAKIRRKSQKNSWRYNQPKKPTYVSLRLHILTSWRGSVKPILCCSKF